MFSITAFVDVLNYRVHPFNELLLGAAGLNAVLPHAVPDEVNAQAIVEEGLNASRLKAATTEQLQHFLEHETQFADAPDAQRDKEHEARERVVAAQVAQLVEQA